LVARFGVKRFLVSILGGDSCAVLIVFIFEVLVFFFEVLFILFEALIIIRIKSKTIKMKDVINSSLTEPEI
jgi:hypothetical protein